MPSHQPTCPRRSRRLNPSVFDERYTLSVYEDCSSENCPYRLDVVDSSRRIVERYEKSDEQPLGNGSYGVVRAYVGEQSRVRIAVKRVKKDDPEVSVVGQLERAGYPCGIIRARTAVCSDCRYAYVVMDTMDGSLEGLMRTMELEKTSFSHDAVVRIADQLTAQVGCLGGMGLWYTDLKPDNVLYRYEDGAIVVHLADLGSMAVGRSGGRTTTYPVLTSANLKRIQTAVQTDHLLQGLFHYHAFNSIDDLRQGVLFLLADLIAHVTEMEHLSDPEVYMHNPSGRRVYRLDDLEAMVRARVEYAPSMQGLFPHRAFHKWLTVDQESVSDFWKAQEDSVSDAKNKRKR